MKFVSSKNVVYAFEPNMKPVERIASGELLEVETKDCFSNQITNEEQTLDEIDFSRINPATGPIYVDGAERGDALKIEISSIALPPVGVMIIAPNEGVLGSYVKEPRTRVLKIENNSCFFNGVAVPVRPMIGVIGVAPAKGIYPTGVPWKHGGNMDTLDITKGATLYLPVNQDGALLALGDCHAAMGDGEVCVTGCEISSKVRMKISVVKGLKLEWPWVERGNYMAVIVSEDTVEKAVEVATRCMVDRVSLGLNVKWEDAYMLASLAMDVKVSQLVDPKKTVRACIPKEFLRWDV